MFKFTLNVFAVAIIASSTQALSVETDNFLEYGYNGETEKLTIPDWYSANANFSTSNPVFSQKAYEETVGAQADMLITLEALRKDITKIMMEMADIEVYIYGNSQDVHDNKDGVDANVAGWPLRTGWST